MRVNDRSVAASLRVRAGDLVEAIPPDPEPSAHGAGADPARGALRGRGPDRARQGRRNRRASGTGSPGRHARQRAAPSLRRPRRRRRRAAPGHRAPPRPRHLRRARGREERPGPPRTLSEQFREHSVERVYLALVRGVPGPESGRDRFADRPPRARPQAHERPLARRARRGDALARRAPLSREARAACSRCGRVPVARTRSACTSPRSGCRSRATPSTAVAAARRWTPSSLRPALHAERLAFTHPRSGARLAFRAELPEDLARLLRELERREGAA